MIVKPQLSAKGWGYFISRLISGGVSERRGGLFQILNLEIIFVQNHNKQYSNTTSDPYKNEETSYIQVFVCFFVVVVLLEPLQKIHQLGRSLVTKCSFPKGEGRGLIRDLLHVSTSKGAAYEREVLKRAFTVIRCN